MTCVVALRTDHSILLGSDSLASDTDIGVHRVDPKVFRLGEFGIGYGGSFRFGQIVQYFFNPPKITKKDKQDLFSYMIKKFVPELRKTLDTLRSECLNTLNANGIGGNQWRQDNA